MLNKVMIIGNLGADPETRFTQAGTAVASFNVAVTETWMKDGEKQTKTEWMKVVAWARLGEICGEYLSKGSKVYIEGKLQTRKWTDNDGNDRYITEVIAREMQMLSPKGQSNSGSGQNRDEEPPLPEPTMGDDVPF